MRQTVSMRTAEGDSETENIGRLMNYVRALQTTRQLKMKVKIDDKVNELTLIIRLTADDNFGIKINIAKTKAIKVVL